MSKSKTNIRTATLSTAFLVLVICQIVTSAPSMAYDYDNIRDLYEMLLRQESPNQFVHQMERKGGRGPSLRLRFGRRSDPLWSKLSIPNGNGIAMINGIGGGGGNSMNDDEKVPYKK